ncbi:polysaccharide biosynthesis/export family protein [Thermoproteota archaeon]
MRLCVNEFFSIAISKISDSVIYHVNKRRMDMRLKLGRSLFISLAVAILVSTFVVTGVGFAQDSSQEAGQGLRVVRPTLEGEFLGASSEYKLGKGDVVKVTVRNQPELSNIFIVDPAGNIQYSFVGDVKAEGLTKDELKNNLVIALGEYVKKPEVTVNIAAYRSKFVYLLGEVRSPGKYPMRGDVVSLREAIVAAGLPTDDAALRRVHVITPHETNPTMRKVDIYEVLYLGKLENDLRLKPNDVVVVSTTIPAEISKALRNLLSPFNRAADVDDFYNRYND